MINTHVFISILAHISQTNVERDWLKNSERHGTAEAWAWPRPPVPRGEAKRGEESIGAGSSRAVTKGHC